MAKGESGGDGVGSGGGMRREGIAGLFDAHVMEQMLVDGDMYTPLDGFGFQSLVQAVLCVEIVEVDSEQQVGQVVFDHRPAFSG
jgi:hypothetical protein